jgi:hypothetical protein
MVFSLATHTPDPFDLRQIDLFAEQLDLTAALLRAGGVARGRMAVVAIDSLADVLLYRHMQFSFGASEEMGGRFATRRFDQRERDRLRQDFDRRVTLATTVQTGPMTFAYPKPILDAQDATTFRVAHRYRNGVYHEDRHNDALLDPLARLYIAAVGRAWCRAQPAVSKGGSAGRLKGLRYVPRHAHAPDKSIIVLPQAVEQLIPELLQDLDVAPRKLAERLAADLVARADAADEARQQLARDGLHRGAHAEMLRHAELRHAHRADPEYVRLQDLSATILDQAIHSSNPQADVDLGRQLREAEQQQRERIDALRSDFKPQLSVRTPDSVRHAAGRIRQLRDSTRLLPRYERQDARLRLLESCLGWLDREWDRFITSEEDLRRGK